MWVSSDGGSSDAGSSGAPLTAGQAGAANGAGVPVAAGSAAKTRIGSTIDPADLPGGSTYRNPANGRNEIIVKDTSNVAVLIGDSQSEPAFGWPRQGLAAAGYKVFFCGRGGTGYVASNGKTGNYIDALQRGDWKLPYGTPPLVVIEGGGNDAARGASNAQIVANAERLIASIQQRYPAARVLMVGTLARGAHYGGGRRSEVDTLLGQGGGPARAAVRQRGRLAHPVQPHGLDGGRCSPEPAGPRGPGRRFRPAAGVNGARLRGPRHARRFVPLAPDGRQATGRNLSHLRGTASLHTQQRSATQHSTTKEPVPAPTGGHRLLCC